MSRKQRLWDTLTQHLSPERLTIDDETSQHQVPAHAETHFKVLAVSECFETLAPVARHRLVNNALKAEFNQGLHALSLHLYTPKEWSNKKASPQASPICQKKRHKG